MKDILALIAASAIALCGTLEQDGPDHGGAVIKQNQTMICNVASRVACTAVERK